MPPLPDPFAPVIADLERSGYVVSFHLIPEHRFVGDVENFETYVNGQRIGIVAVDVRSSTAQQVARVADQISTAMAEELRVLGRSVSWPPCPDGNMPMKPTVIGNQAMWVSPYERPNIAPTPIGDWGHRP